jgi:hypothetical protein
VGRRAHSARLESTAPRCELRKSRPVYSEAAERFLAALCDAEGMLCVECNSALLGDAKWAVMKLTRELIVTGDVLADFQACPACGRLDLGSAPRASPVTPNFRPPLSNVGGYPVTNS